MAGKFNFSVPRGFDYLTRQMSKMFDKATTAVSIVDWDHHKIHVGDHYEMNEVYDQSINAVLDIRMTTPDNLEWVHMALEFDTENETETWFYEVVTIETVGAAYVPLNSNRNSPNTAGLVIDVILNSSLANANADTGLGSAVTLRHAITGSGKSEGGGGERKELVLKQNTIYALRVEASVAGYAHIRLDWYENTDANI